MNVYIGEGEQGKHFYCKNEFAVAKTSFFWTDKAPIFFLVDAITIV